MPKFVFILGKNPELSATEVISYLKARHIAFQIEDFNKEFLSLLLEKEIYLPIGDFGGLIKIGRVLETAPYNDVYEKSFSTGLGKFFPAGKKFCVNIYPSSPDNYKMWRRLSDYFKGEMEKSGIKASFFNLPKNRSCSTHVETIKQGLEKSGDILFCKSDSKGVFYIGKTIDVHNPFEFQKRDVKKPEQRPMLSISPRLAKIMINLCGLTKGRLLDPFCGFGSILQEAALMGFDVAGVDIDKTCIEACNKNLDWIRKGYRINFDSRLFSCDSTKLATKFSRHSIDCVVTEPYMGPPLKSVPSQKTAQKILRDLYPLYTGLFRQLSIVMKPKGRICIVSPRFQTKGGGFGLEIENIASRHGFRKFDPLHGAGIEHKYPFLDFEERHRLIREIHVLEKVDFFKQHEIEKGI